jgi:hypothetical protein
VDTFISCGNRYGANRMSRLVSSLSTCSNDDTIPPYIPLDPSDDDPIGAALVSSFSSVIDVVETGHMVAISTTKAQTSFKLWEDMTDDTTTTTSMSPPSNAKPKQRSQFGISPTKKID